MDFKNYNRETEDIKNNIRKDRKNTTDEIMRHLEDKFGKIPDVERTMTILNTRKKVEYKQDKFLNEIGEY